MRLPSFALGVVLLLGGMPAHTLDRPAVIERSKPSIVGIGTLQATRRPPNQLRGTGFVVTDGRHVVTNAHVLPEKLDDANREKLVVYVGSGRNPEVRDATPVARDTEHDLVLLRVDGAPLPALAFGDSATVREGQDILFIGFPIGGVLGLYPVTSHGIVSAITPSVIPAATTRELTTRQIRALDDPYFVFQLDATAYPGNSGSPVIATDSGLVIGIVNQVLVKETKENVLKDPSAITYAIPARFLETLLTRLK